MYWLPHNRTETDESKQGEDWRLTFLLHMLSPLVTFGLSFTSIQTAVALVDAVRPSGIEHAVFWTDHLKPMLWAVSTIQLCWHTIQIRFGWSSCTIQLEWLVYQCLDTHLIYMFLISKLWWETTFPLFDFESVMKDVHCLSNDCGTTNYNYAVGFWIASLPWTRLLLNLKGLWLAFKLNSWWN